MKNFKRVISAVIALALSASTLVAVSASKFSDVDSTNSYAEAIEALTALDIVHGYEDGSFKPDGDITRAEAATMIVGALNMTKDAQAAAGTSKFTDVNEKASWASGYVNVGVAQGFINGMDDTTFAPQENVTYAQMCVMLTLITGYGDYAKAYGGYPTGYTTIAAQTGINKGVAVAADTALKRGQVAQMLYNAMVTPMLGVKNYSLQGNEYAVSDGDDIAFKTILSSKFNGYEAEIRIDGTPKTGEDKGKASIALTEDTYLDEVKESKQEKATGAATWKTIYDDFGVEDFLHMSGKAILTKDGNKEWHLVYFEADDNDTVVVNAADYVKKADGGKDLDDTDHKITFGSKDYQVNFAAAEVYVNGKVYLTGATLTEANFEKVLDVAQGEVKLIDSDTTVKGYEKIMVTAYDIAKVQSVTYTNKTTTLSVEVKAGIEKTINGAAASTITTLKVKDDDVEEGNIDLTVKNAAGEKVALSSIKKDDIIAFAIDPSKTKSQVDDLKTLDIIVTDEVVSGMVTKIDDTEEVVTINGKDYKAVDYNATIKNKIELKDTYKAYIDPFGRIYSTDVEATDAKFAIAEQYSKDYGVQLILPNATAKWYEIDLTDDKILDPTNATGLAIAGKITLAQFETYIETTKSLQPLERVVEYVVKSNGKVTEIKLYGATETKDMEYKGRTEKLDGKSIIDSTAILDVTDYKANSVSSYATFATSALVDGTKYNGVVLKAGSANTAAFIVLTKVGETITADSRFAVARKAAVSATSADGDPCYSVSVLYDGQEQDLLFDKKPALKAGDAFFFVTNSEGLVSDYLTVLTLTKKGTAKNPTFAGAFTDFATNNIGALSKTFTFDASKWDYTVKNTAKKDYQLVYGIVTDVTNKGIEMVNADALNATTKQIDIDASAEFFGVDSDYIAYRYDINSESADNNQYKAIVAGTPSVSVLSAYDTEDSSGKTIYDLDDKGDKNGESHLNYALALIIDGDIAEIYTIVQ